MEEEKPSRQGEAQVQWVNRMESESESEPVTATSASGAEETGDENDLELKPAAVEVAQEVNGSEQESEQEPSPTAAKDACKPIDHASESDTVQNGEKKHEEEENQIVVNLKFIHLDQISVRCSPSIGIAELKQKVLAKHFARLPSDQRPSDADSSDSVLRTTPLRLIYKGKVLKDDQSLETYNFNSEDTMHAVFGPPQSQQQNQSQSQSAATASSSSPSSSSTVPRATVIPGVSNASMRDFGNGVLMGQIHIDADSDSPMPDIGGIINSMLSNMGGANAGETVIISSSNMDLGGLTSTSATSAAIGSTSEATSTTSSTSTSSFAASTADSLPASTNLPANETTTSVSSAEEQSATSSGASSSVSPSSSTTTSAPSLTDGATPIPPSSSSTVESNHLLNHVARLRRSLPPIELAPHSQPSGLSNELFSLSTTLREASDTFLAVHRQLQFLSTRFLVENELNASERTRLRLRVAHLVPFLSEMSNVSTALSSLLTNSSYGSNSHHARDVSTTHASPTPGASSTPSNGTASFDRPTISMRSFHFGNPVTSGAHHQHTSASAPAPAANGGSGNQQPSSNSNNNASTGNSSSSPFDVFQFVNMVAQTALNATGSGHNARGTAPLTSTSTSNAGVNPDTNSTTPIGSNATGTSNAQEGGLAGFLNLVSAISAAASSGGSNSSPAQNPTEQNQNDYPSMAGASGDDQSPHQSQNHQSTATATASEQSPQPETESQSPTSSQDQCQSHDHQAQYHDNSNVCLNPLSRLLLEIVKGWPEDFGWDENSNGSEALSIVRQQIESMLPNNHFNHVEQWCENAVVEVELAMQLVLEDNHRWCVDDEIRKPLFVLLMRKFVELCRRHAENGLNSMDFEMQLMTLLKMFWGMLFMEMVEASSITHAPSLTLKILEELMSSVEEQDDQFKLAVQRMTKWMRRMMDEYLHACFAFAV